MPMECNECKKKFDTKEALEQHMNDKHRAAPQKEKKKSISAKKVILPVIIIIIIIAGAAMLMQKPKYTPLPPVIHTIGNGSAEIIEFSDFQCPACGAAFPEVEGFLEKNLDKVTFTYKHYPLTQIHPFAYKAAEASECASDQGKFWEYYKALFNNQQKLQRGDLIGYAKALGLDADSFTACLDSGAMASRVNIDMTEAQQKLISSTPTFFINGRKITGIITERQYEAEIGVF